MESICTAGDAYDWPEDVKFFINKERGFTGYGPQILGVSATVDARLESKRGGSRLGHESRSSRFPSNVQDAGRRERPSHIHKSTEGTRRSVDGRVGKLQSDSSPSVLDMLTLYLGKETLEKCTSHVNLTQTSIFSLTNHSLTSTQLEQNNNFRSCILQQKWQNMVPSIKPGDNIRRSLDDICKNFFTFDRPRTKRDAFYHDCLIILKNV